MVALSGIRNDLYPHQMIGLKMKASSPGTGPLIFELTELNTVYCQYTVNAGREQNGYQRLGLLNAGTPDDQKQQSECHWLGIGRL